MTQVWLSLGSNVNRHLNITAALDALSSLLENMVVSRIFESESVGFAGSNFFNLVVGGRTTLTVSELTHVLKFIEDENGRVRTGPKFSPRTLDIDILLFGDKVGVIDGVELPRAEITKNAFVLWPLQDLAPDLLHPIVKKSYRDLWDAYDKSSQSLWPIDFDWHGHLISSQLL